jgi:hypothetical protein
MLSLEQLERYRRMTPGERFRVTAELARSDWAYLESLPDPDRRLRLELMRRRREESNRRLVDVLRRLP